MKKNKFNITGMSCAACSSRVEKTVNKISGVEKATVSLMTNSMSVVYNDDITEEQIIDAVTKAGYGATLQDGNDDNFVDTQPNEQKHRFILSFILLIPIIYLSQQSDFSGINIFQINLSKDFLEIFLTLLVIIVNRKLFISGIKNIIHLSPNMDSLVALGSGISFIWSLFTFGIKNDLFLTGLLSPEQLKYSYYETAAMILTIISFGKLLESRSKSKATEAIKNLIQKNPQTALVVRDGKEYTIKASEVVKGDIFIVKPGSAIPVDGVVISGESSVDEASLTGESIPVVKEKDSLVYAATINGTGVLRCTATNSDKDTIFYGIINLVKNAVTSKPKIARIADIISGIFVPIVTLIAIITFISWMLIGKDLGFALNCAISVLVISCPCALGLATPVSIMVGNGIGAKNGILFHDAEAMEKAGKIKSLAFDKTGTLTTGNIEISEIIPLNGISEKELLKIAASLEKSSEHIIGKAIVKKAQDENISLLECDNFSSLIGKGVSAKIDNENYRAGNRKFISEIIPETSLPDESEFDDKTVLYFSKGDTLLGIIKISDTLRETSPLTIATLKDMNIYSVMLTGDKKSVASETCKKLQIDDFIAEILPNGKLDAIKQLQNKYGITGMLGDGINDSPALAQADIGFAMGGGTSVAINVASVVLMHSDPYDAIKAIKLSKAVIRNIHENLFWAFIYNLIGIPVAAGCFYSLLGWQLSPALGALAMSLSSVFVVSNALRLNFLKLGLGEKNSFMEIIKKIFGLSNQPLGKDQKLIKITGMKCEHCQGRVKTALENLPNVSKASVKHKKGEAIIDVKADIPDSEIISCIDEAGYKVTKIVNPD